MQGGEVYCSCWRLKDHETVNLHTLMDLFGFKEVVHNRVHWAIPYNCSRTESGINKCPYYLGSKCECYEDLYLRMNNKT
jgi:hypothetical protein